MAEHGAHLTSSGVSDASLPSIFEVLAQQSLSATLHPAIGHAVRVFAEKYPERLGVLVRYYDEIYLLFDTLVQSYYLKKHGGSFAENFYDLKRVPSGNVDSSVLSQRLRLRALACLVLIPYIKQKLHSLYEKLLYNMGDSGRRAFLQREASKRQKLKGLYLLCFPYASSAWELLTLIYQLQYMLRHGRWHSPSMHLSGTELRHVSDEDVVENDAVGLFDASWSNMSVRSRLLRLIKLTLNSAAVAMSTSLSVGVFFLQFLEWWYASDSSATSLTALPVPAPPHSEKLKDVPCSCCPLCRRERVNSTALVVSGYVFCYTCINEHVKRHRCCPITGFPATDEQLVKIYEQQL
ncbi:peroxisome assembly protein 12 [Aplysia californica]|uniref:Peroxisome assembly protein 12 n=1 Tax=Aplysia californica TaxID=6500 RepID=A0ABM1VRG9_APLCA|nr:peroxisome assembly protein 12 [Aplysia californica]XP_035825010.1 peroxisome assembly protein 12 [Aplysia californica]XP_035825011.1 peroxisome assembly protein 12 [Aplysia californica]